MVDTIIIDRGHGLLNPQGVYVTPGKRAKLPDGRQVYEGVENQKYALAIEKWAKHRGFKVEYTVPNLDFHDVTLAQRVRTANNSKNAKTAIFVSIHNNAANGKAVGTEVFTSIGQTLSDIYAEGVIKEIMRVFPDRRMRTCTLDKDLDKEANFYVLKHTTMPAILIEYGFFDTPSDYDWLSNPDVIDRAAKATVDGICAGILNLYGHGFWDKKK